MLNMGMLVCLVAFASTPAVLSDLRAPPISMSTFRDLTSDRNLRRLVGVGLLFEVVDWVNFPGALLRKFTLDTRQHVMVLAVLHAVPPRPVVNLFTDPLTVPLLPRYVPRCDRNVPPPVGSVPENVLASLAVTLPWVLPENYRRGPLFLTVLIALVVEMTAEPWFMDPAVYELHLVLPDMTTRVPRSPVILDAPGLKLRVLIPAESRTEAMPMLALLTRLVREFYRPTDVMMATGLAGLPVEGRLDRELLLAL